LPARIASFGWNDGWLAFLHHCHLGPDGYPEGFLSL
jgi:hypothetical protein